MDPLFVPNQFRSFFKRKTTQCEKEKGKEKDKEKNVIYKIKDNYDEILVCEKIMKIPFFFNYFSLPKLHASTSNHFYIIEYNSLIPFVDFFSIDGEKNKEKEKIVLFVRAYSHLMDAIHVMNKHNLLHGRYGKIGLNQYYQPLFYGFLPSLDETILMGEKEEQREKIPIEMFVLGYLKKMRHLSSLSILQIEDILNLYFQEEQEKQKEEMQNKQKEKREKMKTFLNTFINLPKKDIVAQLLKKKHTWDCFITNSLFLDIIERNQWNYQEFFHITNSNRVF